MVYKLAVRIKRRLRGDEMQVVSQRRKTYIKEAAKELSVERLNTVQGAIACIDHAAESIGTIIGSECEDAIASKRDSNETTKKQAEPHGNVHSVKPSKRHHNVAHYFSKTVYGS